MKKVRPALLLFLLALPASAALFYAAAPRFNLSIDLPFVSRKKEADSQLVFLESREVLALATVEYLYKSVFPHDFIPEGTDFRALFSRLFRGETLTPEEERLVEIYRVCADVGIDPELEQYRFAVITARVKGGWDLRGTGMSVEETPEGLVITLPRPVITDLIIEDETSGRYSYPDLQAGPAAWKKITGLTEEEIRRRVLAEGILDEAETRGKTYLEMLFAQAGYRSISFRTYPSKSE